MASYEILHDSLGARGQTRDFLQFAVPTAAAHCTRVKGSTWITQDHHISSSYSSSRSHQTLINTLAALLSSPLPSCTHRYTATVRQTGLVGKSSQMTQLWVVADTSTHTVSLTKPNSFSSQHFAGEAWSQILFSMASNFFFVFFFLHSISSFLVWIKLTAHYVPGYATQSRIENKLKTPQFQLWHWGSCAQRVLRNSNFQQSCWNSEGCCKNHCQEAPHDDIQASLFLMRSSHSQDRRWLFLNFSTEKPITLL